FRGRKPFDGGAEAEPLRSESNRGAVGTDEGLAGGKQRDNVEPRRMDDIVAECLLPVPRARLEPRALRAGIGDAITDDGQAFVDVAEEHAAQPVARFEQNLVERVAID